MMTEEEKKQLEISKIIMEEWAKLLSVLEDNAVDQKVIDDVEKIYKKPLKGEKQCIEQDTPDTLPLEE